MQGWWKLWLHGNFRSDDVGPKTSKQIMQLSKALKQLDAVDASFYSHSLDVDSRRRSKQDSCERSTSYWWAYKEYMIKKQWFKMDMHLYKKSGLPKQLDLGHLPQLFNTGTVWSHSKQGHMRGRKTRTTRECTIHYLLAIIPSLPGKSDVKPCWSSISYWSINH